MTIRCVRSVWLALVLVAGLLFGETLPPTSGTAAAAGAENQPTDPMLKTQAAIHMSAEGLVAKSPRRYWVWQKGRCVLKPIAGKTVYLAPETYEIRVGFSSGYVAHEVELVAGQTYEVPTGLFTFKQLTAAELPSTVPQGLYQGNTYLGTGYQGITVRLSAGKYKVCYQDLNDEQPSVAFGPWHVLGIFPNPQEPRKHHGLQIKYPPEDDLIPDIGKTYKRGSQELGWKKIEDYPEIRISEVIPAWGIAYATASIDSDSDREAQLIMTFCGGIKVWLNGELIETLPVPTRAYTARRTAEFVKLKKGRNSLLVKTPRTTGHWPLSAVAVRWVTYKVDVAADSPQAAQVVVKPDGGKENQ